MGNGGKVDYPNWAKRGPFCGSECPSSLSSSSSSSSLFSLLSSPKSTLRAKPATVSQKQFSFFRSSLFFFVLHCFLLLFIARCFLQSTHRFCHLSSFTYFPSPFNLPFSSSSHTILRFVLVSEQYASPDRVKPDKNIDRGFFVGLHLVRLHVDVNDRSLVNEDYTGSSARYPGINPVRLHAGVFDGFLVKEY